MKRIISVSLLGLVVGLSIGCGSKTATKSIDKGSDAPVTPAVAKSETSEEALKGLAGSWKVVSVQNLPPYSNAEYVKNLTARIEGKVIKLSKGIGYFDQGEI